jgi:heme/copper-type cytochrome/quinol oxidase subunit 4
MKGINVRIARAVTGMMAISALVPLNLAASNTAGANAAREAFATPIANLTGFFSEFAKLAFIIVIVLLLIAMYFNKSDEPKVGMVRACVIVACVIALPTIVSLVVSGGATI